MKKVKKEMPTVKELKDKAPLADIYKIQPNCKYLIIHKQGRIIQVGKQQAREEIDKLVLALTGLEVRAVGLILDSSENISILEIANL